MKVMVDIAKFKSITEEVIRLRPFYNFNVEKAIEFDNNSEKPVFNICKDKKLGKRYYIDDFSVDSPKIREEKMLPFFSLYEAIKNDPIGVIGQPLIFSDKEYINFINGRTYILELSQKLRHIDPDLLENVNIDLKED